MGCEKSLIASRRFMAAGVVSLIVICGMPKVLAQTNMPFSHMAALSAYLMEQNAEISLARDAAPAGISSNAEVLVLSMHGYERAASGTNGFTCVVERGWSAASDDPDFWNPRLRAPICFNAAAAKSQIPILIRRTQLVLGGASKEEMFARMKESFAKGESKPPETGSMCFMMSKQGYLSSRGGHWRPHLMFFFPLTEPSAWGATVADSPIIAFRDEPEQMTVFLVPIDKWSDGEPSPLGGTEQ